MRRFLFIASLFLALGCVGCDEAAVKQGAAEAAGAAADSTVPTIALIGAIASSILGAFGIKRAGVGAKYAEGGWSKEEVDELVVALRGHGYKVERV